LIFLLGYTLFTFFKFFDFLEGVFGIYRVDDVSGRQMMWWVTWRMMLADDVSRSDLTSAEGG